MSRTIIFAAAIAATVCGCNGAPQPASNPVAPTAAKIKPAKGDSNADPGILPMGGGAMTPVTNPGAVDGGGSGVGQAAKNAAKSTAEKLSQSNSAASTDASTDE